ncbi:flagella basal body P-ring formation protein FlgA [Sphingomonas sp.]|uniref:flagella basal body P-ring formation protein FlgA n=1 Tax=Sphingomonas sp. TaxID=28214 RepID=UPI002CF2530C|nr:flagella basal body P-ring formation protein FlgA [Sphingomonas sp.]HTG39428.1 flagella basal body P-ring formation protein FlgA [Sphingomonas sp.]
MIPALLLLAIAAAPDFQSTALLDTAVEQFTGHAIGEDGGALTRVDTRLKLASCPMPQFEWRGTARDAVVVRCMAPVWRIYVPVKSPKSAPRPMIAASAPAPIAAAAKPEIVVKRGDPVTVAAGSAGFSITRDGVAMGDAPRGGRLMVRVDPRKPPIQAVAVDAGRVTLPGWTD